MDEKIKPFYKTNQWYAFSFNPEDKYQFYGKFDRFQKFKNHYFELLMKFKGDYFLVTEVSEPRGKLIKSRGPRLHCHGVIRFSSNKHILHFLLLTLPLFCNHNTIELDTIDKGIDWYKYIMKQSLLPYDRKIITNFADVHDNDFTRFVGQS